MQHTINFVKKENSSKWTITDRPEENHATMPLKYTVIRSEKQYQDYCTTLENKVVNGDPDEDEVDLLTTLIEKWERENSSFKELDPVEMIKALMHEHDLKAKDLGNILSLSKGTVSKILNYKKGLSKASIRKLAAHFKMAQEAFNRPYRLAQADQQELANGSE